MVDRMDPQELTNWIDPGVIVDAIKRGLGESYTTELGRTVWLNVLETGLTEDIRYAIEAIEAGWKP